MRKNIALLFIIIVASFYVSQSAFSDGHNHPGVAQKLEIISQGLVGRNGIAVQEIGAGERACNCSA